MQEPTNKSYMNAKPHKKHYTQIYSKPKNYLNTSKQKPTNKIHKMLKYKKYLNTKNLLLNTHHSLLKLTKINKN